MAFSATAYAYDPAMDPTKAIETIKSIDCAKSIKECRYYAAVEYVAFYSGCRSVIEKYEHREVSDEEWKKNAGILENWSIFLDPKLNKAVLKSENPLRTRWTTEVTLYLLKIPAQEAAMECERIPLIKDNVKPEDMSDVLQESKNYDQWRMSRGPVRMK